MGWLCSTCVAGKPVKIKDEVFAQCIMNPPTIMVGPAGPITMWPIIQRPNENYCLSWMPKEGYDDEGNKEQTKPQPHVPRLIGIDGGK